LITCRLYGRLGNQAFQIASTIGIAKRNGLKYVIPSKTVAPNVWSAYFSNLFTEDVDETKFVRIKEIKHSYTPVNVNHSLSEDFKGWVLDGYWQSERYFKDCINEVREVLRVPNLTQGDVVSVHYRAGDYRDFSDKHPLVSEEYIYKAVKYFSELGFKNFKLFSDEPDTLLNMVHASIFEELGVNFFPSEGKTPIEDFYLMIKCAHGIVANSTFSVMAHILNSNENKIIVRPSYFFGPGNAALDEKDIYPPKWIVV
jgi:hypothetical protein